MPGVQRTDTSERTTLTTLDKLDGGWSTRSYPHQLKDSQLAVLDNFVRIKDSIWTIRPGNVAYGNGTGATGSKAASLAGKRFYFGNPVKGQLCVQSGGGFYTGNDATGAFTMVGGGMSTTQPASMAQMYDPDNANGAATTLFICDGSRAPRTWDGTHFTPVNTTATFLPTGEVSNLPITPLYVTDWNYNLVYANEPTDPTAVWISDPLRPESFTATALVGSNGVGYTPYYPGGRNSSLGVITGIVGFGQFLIVFFTAGIVVGYNTGSYGTFQYVWNVLSRTIGCPAPRSIVPMDAQVCFFGGDRFYATDGQYLFPLPDELPSVYGHQNTSQGAPEMTNIGTIAAFRAGLNYMVGYQSNVGNVYNDRMLVFDTGAQGGWSWGSPTPTGGAWSRFPSGMPLNWGMECRGPGDDTNSFPIFWGASNQDLIATYDPFPDGAFTDFGSPIQFEIRTKSFFFDRPINPKVVEGIYPILVFNTLGVEYNVTVDPYAIFDNGSPFTYSPLTYEVPAIGAPVYGATAPLYGTIIYGFAEAVLAQQTQKSYSTSGPMLPKGFSISAGLSGSSSNSFNIIGFVVESINLEPEF